MPDAASVELMLELLPDPHVIIDTVGAVLAATPHFDRRLLTEPRVLQHLAVIDDPRGEFTADIDGRRRIYSASWMPCRKNGKEARLVRLIDVTEEREHSEALERTVHALEDALDALPGSLLLANGDGRIMSANARWHILARANGLTMSNAGIGANYLEVCDRSAQEGDPYAREVADGLRAVLQGRSMAFDIEYAMPIDSDTEKWFSLSINALGAHPGAIIQHHDITDNHRQQEERIEALAHFKAVFDGALDGIIIFNDSLQLLSGNAAARTLLGLAEDAQKLPVLTEYVLPEDHERLVVDREELLSLGEVRGQLRMRTSDGQVAEIEYAARANVVPGRHVAVLRDITTSRLLEAQLRQAQKMEALGQLTGGIAHDFNNLLTVIHAQCDLLLSDPRLHPDSQEEVEQVLRASQRGADMVRKLMAFGRREQLRAVPMQLHLTVQEVGGILRRLLPETIEVECHVEGDIPAVRADATAVQQILLNLATNARDAMREGGGTLRFVTSVRQPTAQQHRDAASPPEISTANRRYVRVEISDTGCGMNAEVLAHIFEPFFTTKRLGEGTGLGMSMVYGLMNQMGGFVTVDSRVGGGTSIQLFFPALRSSAPTPAVVPSIAADGDHGSERILLVEDDADIRTLTARVLRRAGYHVTEAVNGEDAADRLRMQVGSEEPPFALVISDMVMPHGDGLYVLEATRRFAAPARIVWVSGYAGDGFSGFPGSGTAGAREGSPASPVHTNAAAPIIQKPWTTTEFLSRIRAVLDAPPNVPLASSTPDDPSRAG